jgi:hypothetical protein
MGPRPEAFPSPGTAIGTSLVFLPQQFTNGLKASDSRIRILRANLMWTAWSFRAISIPTSGSVTACFTGMPARRPRQYAADGVALPDAPQLAERGRKDVMVRLWAAIAAVK